MSVFEINPLEDPRWRDFVRSHPAASVFHQPEWLAALSQTYGYEPFVLTTDQPGEPLQNGVVFCRVTSMLTGSRVVSLPFSDHCEPLVSEPADLIEIAQYLRELSLANGWKYVELRPVIGLNSGIMDSTGLIESESFCLHILDLRPDEQALFKSFHKSCIQRKLQRAGKDGLTLEVGRSDRLLDMFYRLLLLTRRRHQLPPQPMLWFRNLIESFGDGLSIWVALKDGQPIASLLTILSSQTLTYKYGCSDSKFHNLGGMPFLFWQAIRDGKHKGATQFDFGRSEMDNPGLISFKDHWGGFRRELKYYRYPGSGNGNDGKKWRRDAVGKMFSLLPDFCLTTAGRLLYKHMG